MSPVCGIFYIYVKIFGLDVYTWVNVEFVNTHFVWFSMLIPKKVLAENGELVYVDGKVPESAN